MSDIEQAPMTAIETRIANYFNQTGRRPEKILVTTDEWRAITRALMSDVPLENLKIYGVAIERVSG